MFSLFMIIITFVVSLKTGDPMFLIACSMFCIAFNISLLRNSFNKKIEIDRKEDDVKG